MRTRGCRSCVDDAGAPCIPALATLIFREIAMKRVLLAAMLAGSMSLGACSTYNDRETLESAGTGAAIGAGVGAVGGAIIPGVSPVEGAVAGAVVGAIAGTIAADRDNDGRVDGYYRDGVYYPYETYEAPPPP